MKYKLLIILPALICQVAGAQTGTATLTSAAETGPAPVPVTSAAATVSAESPADPSNTQIAIMDYKSVYEAPTVEEEVKMAAERFNLTPAQQEVWLMAATDRRQAEKQAQEKFDSKAANWEKEGAYRGLRSSHNTFHESIIGYLSPAQKQAFEEDRLILNEKQRRLAKLPPPPPPAPTVTVAPVDSSAIKEEESKKAKGKKAKKKKKSAGQKLG